MRRHAAACLLCLAASAAGQTPEPITTTGEYFTLIAHVEQRAVAEQALAAIDATWPVAIRLYGAATAPPRRRPVVRLYRDPAQYEAAEFALTRGRFRRNLAFAHWDSQSAHIAIQPRLSDTVLGEYGLNAQTLRLLVHEAAHLARFHAMPNYRSHPAWFSDGNASWIEVEVMRSLGYIERAEADPTFATHIGIGQRLLRRNAWPSIDAIVHDRLGDCSFYERYAVRWLWFRYLAAHRRTALRTALDRLRGFGGVDATTAVAQAVVSAIGRAELQRADRELRQSIRDQRPQWREVTRSLQTGERWLQTAFEDVAAAAWRTAPAAAEDFAVRGSVRIAADGARTLRVLLGAAPPVYYSVGFAAGRGVELRRHRDRDDPGTVVRFDPAPAITTGTAIAFAVRGSGQQLRVRVAGRDLPAVPVSRLSGTWGLGATPGSAGEWLDIDCGK